MEKENKIREKRTTSNEKTGASNTELSINASSNNQLRELNSKIIRAPHNATNKSHAKSGEVGHSFARLITRSDKQ